MGALTSIEWTDATWNPVGGCEIKSPGCVHCYAQQLAGTRLRTHPLYAGTTDLVKSRAVFNGTLTALPEDHPTWSWPCRWRGAKRPRLGAGAPSVIFVGDMSDLFHPGRPREVIDRVMAGIIYSEHIGQFLTKRADVMCEYFTELFLSGRWRWWPHPVTGEKYFTSHAPSGVFARVWCGVSAERQAEADERIPLLLRTPMAAKRFVSCEPLIGPLDLTSIPRTQSDGFLRPLDGRFKRLDWVIAGGESGRNARPIHPEWARSLRDQCAAAGVPFFFKQWGEWAPFYFRDDGEPRHSFKFDDGQVVHRIGKTTADRLLDHVLHDGMPTP